MTPLRFFDAVINGVASNEVPVMKRSVDIAVVFLFSIIDKDSNKSIDSAEWLAFVTAIYP